MLRLPTAAFKPLVTNGPVTLAELLKQLQYTQWSKFMAQKNETGLF